MPEIQLNRRSFFSGLAAAFAAPAIVRAASIMPVKALILPPEPELIIPISSGLYADLTDMTRAAFVPRLFVQIYRADPLPPILEYRP